LIAPWNPLPFDVAVASTLSPAVKISALISCATSYSSALSNLNSFKNFLLETPAFSK